MTPVCRRMGEQAERAGINRLKSPHKPILSVKVAYISQLQSAGAGGDFNFLLNFKDPVIDHSGNLLVDSPGCAVQKIDTSDEAVLAGQVPS